MNTLKLSQKPKYIKIMKNIKSFIFPPLLLVLFLSACATKQKNAKDPIYTYVIEDQKLYDAISSMDSTFFNAYNNCDMEKQAEIYGTALEFYHDKGGLMTSKQEILDGTKKNICGKVTRELVSGSIEVYPIKEYGAVEIGLHKFHNNQEPANTPSTASKFIIMWQFTNEEWRIAKVISLH
ncbi:MAG: hypothetical protein ACI87N_000290 [Flavobacteriales bacterium]